jgi:outer membrane PBP1 activator LpoA protein
MPARLFRPLPFRNSARVARTLAAAAMLLALPALSAAQTAAASNDAAVETGPPAPIPIALVLPLESAAYGRAADAVKAGFLAAATSAGQDVRVIGHADGDPMSGFAQARALGARVVVGPLVRDDLRALVAVGTELPLTIALNQLDDGATLPDHVYALTLAIESEGQQLARLARLQGVRTIGVIGADTPLQRRFASAFVGEWILLGGGLPETYRYERGRDLVALRRELLRTPVDALLLAVDGADASRLKPYVGATRSYTSSQVNDQPALLSQYDLDDVLFIEMPWLANPDKSDLGALARPNYPNAALERLYALGVDAFRVARAFADGAPKTLEFDGATGHLTLDKSRQFAREGLLMQFRGGRAETVDSSGTGNP